MRYADLRTKPKILLGVTPSLLILVFMGVASIMMLDSIMSTHRWVTHTEAVLTESTEVVESAINMETGMRGFLLAGEDQFLGPYRAGEERVYATIEDLQVTVSDNPAQVERLNEARTILQDWQANVVEPMIDLRRRIGNADTMNDMADLVAEQRGKVFFDQFRADIATFISREVDLLAERRAAFDDAMGQVEEDLTLIQETGDWVEHTNHVMADAALLLSHTLDMETGYRGFMLAGEEEFLAPYEAGRNVFFNETAHLQEIVADNPTQVERLARIEAAATEWLTVVVEPGIALRRAVDRGAGTLEEIDTYISQQFGMHYIDAMRAELADFMEMEQALLVERQAAATASEARAAALLVTLSENEAWVTHTYQVIDQANAILTSAIDMETGMRGFLLAGQDAFLEPFEAGNARFSSLVDDLSETVSDNPAQVELLGEMSNTITQWQTDVVLPMIELRRLIGNAETMDDMADLVGEERGRQYFDQFRAVMDAFRAEEESLMVVRQASNEETSEFANSTSWILMIAGVAVGGLLAWLIGSSIARPIERITQAMGKLAKGEKSIDIPGVGRRDEIGQMADAVQVFKENAVKVERLQAEQAEANARADTERRAAMTKLATDFEGSVGQIVDSVSSAAEQLKSSAEAMSMIADESSSQSTTVAAAAEQATHNVQTVASSTVEVSASIQEIARQVQQQSDIAGRATALAAQSRQQVGDLSDHAETIGQVVSLITSIAEQTNLLALNATIEAARAGDAGKGFAVVASEVKNLATQTAKATDEIANQIRGVQEQTGSTVSAIGEIAETVQSMSEIASMVASAVEEQNAAAQEIGRNVQEAAGGTQEVSTGIVAVTKTASEAGTASSQMLAAAQDMSNQASNLSTEVQRFLSEVRAA